MNVKVLILGVISVLAFSSICSSCSKEEKNDWANLDTIMSHLENDFHFNWDKYNDEQVKEIGKIQGKYTALIVKKGFNDFKESIKDFENQMEGFIEGFKDDNDK